MVQPAISNLDVKILEAIVAPEEEAISPSVAKALLSFEFRPKQRVEITKLLDRNNAGTITEKQKTKLEAYVRVGNFLSLLKAKARAALAAKSS